MRSRVDGLIERTLAIQQDAHQSVLLPIGVFDRAFAFSKLSVVALLARGEVRRVPLHHHPSGGGATLIIDIVRPGISIKVGVWQGLLPGTGVRTIFARLQGEDKPSPLLWTMLRPARSIVGAMACPRRLISKGVETPWHR